MFFTQEFLDLLTEHARMNPRLRQHFDLRTTPEDQSQRMLNAMELGTVMPIHRHVMSSETMVVVRGRLMERFYDDKGNVTEEHLMEAGGDFPLVQIPLGQWHSLEVLESGTVIFEAKDGPYSPQGTEELDAEALKS